ncbi:MAG TPA: hypothetical protein VIV40_35450 [Kofleriaceae bacterium]
MTDPLRAEVLVPARPYMRKPLVAAVGMTAITVAFALASPRVQSPHVVVVSVPVTRGEEVAVPIAATQTETAQPVHTSELALVFSAGGASYMKLADVGDSGEAMPKHGKPRLFSVDGVEASIASVKDSDVTESYRHWQGRSVKVDNTCETKVTGFAVVARLTGDTGYASGDEDNWTATNVLEHGSVVLAAKLAGCAGTFARDAALPAVIVPEPIENAKLAEKARAALIASTPARETQVEYLDFDQKGNWWDAEYAQFATKIVRHPTTGVTWVSVHGSMEHGCGDPEVNVWGLFRVQADGTLAAVQLRKLGDLWSIDQLVDIDNDGELELIGKPWLGLDTVVARASGEELERLSLTFFGCPC